MTDTFNSADPAVVPPVTPPAVPNGQGTSFTPDGSEGGNQLTAEQIAALQKRDINAQTHITTLEAENEKFRAEMLTLAEKVDKLGDVDSIMEKLNQVGDNTPVDQAALIEATRAGVMESLNKDKAVAAQDENFKSVQTTLTAQFGDKTDETVKKACEDHGMSWDSMVALAKANPKAALALCKVEVKLAPQASNPSTINLQGFNQQQAPTDESKADFSYATNMSEAQRIKLFMERMAKGA